MSKKIEVLPLYYSLLNSKKRYVLLKGSTRSGKTIAIVQYILTLLSLKKTKTTFKYKNLTIAVGVETISTAREKSIKDLIEWIDNMNLTNMFKINMSNFSFTFIPTGSKIVFVPCDKPSKWYGLKADIFWFNEATHIPYEVFEQAQMRLPDRKDFHNKIILDYNPTDPFSWVRDLENNNPPGGVDLFKSTFYDNPFIGEKQIQLYETWRYTNPNKWLIFGMGEYGEVAGSIIKNWEMCDKFPDEQYYYGLDFGYSNDQSTLIKVCVHGGELYAEEIMYDLSMTATDIVKELNRLEIDKKKEIICESARPEMIEEIRRAGYYVTSVKKGPGSIIAGLDIIQRYKLNVVKPSNNLRDELSNYTWKKKNGVFINEPVDDWNHCIDALRYACMMKLNKRVGPSRTGIIRIRK